MKQDTALDEKLNNVWRLFSLPVSMRNCFFFSYEYLKALVIHLISFYARFKLHIHFIIFNYLKFK